MMNEELLGEVKVSLGSLTRWDAEKMSSGVVQKGVVGQLGVWVKTIRRFGLELRRRNKQGLADALDDRLQAFLLDITHYDRETLIPDSKEYSRLLCDMKLNREGVLCIDTERKESPFKTCLLIDCITNSQNALIEVLQLCLKETEDENDDWDDPAYILATEALRLAGIERNNLPRLSKLLTSGELNIRHMRNKNRCKVHIDDFRTYIKRANYFSRDPFSSEVFAATEYEIEKRKNEIRQEKAKKTR